MKAKSTFLIPVILWIVAGSNVVLAVAPGFESGPVDCDKVRATLMTRYKEPELSQELYKLNCGSQQQKQQPPQAKEDAQAKQGIQLEQQPESKPSVFQIIESFFENFVFKLKEFYRKWVPLTPSKTQKEFLKLEASPESETSLEAEQESKPVSWNGSYEMVYPAGQCSGTLPQDSPAYFGTLIVGSNKITSNDGYSFITSSSDIINGEARVVYRDTVESLGCTESDLLTTETYTFHRDASGSATVGVSWKSNRTEDCPSSVEGETRKVFTSSCSGSGSGKKIQ